jgi:D-xylose transport system permease protein
VPFSVLTLLAVILVVTYVAKNTVFGSRIYAMGGNREAAILSGINVRKNVVWLFVFMGFICAIGGILYTARLNAASPGGGLGLDFAAITAVIIGGTSFHGGEGNIPGAIIGSLLMGTLDNGMSLMNLGVEYQTAVGGLVLLIALWADSATKRSAQPR